MLTYHQKSFSLLVRTEFQGSKLLLVRKDGCKIWILKLLLILLNQKVLIDLSILLFKHNT